MAYQDMYGHMHDGSPPSEPNYEGEPEWPALEVETPHVKHPPFSSSRRGWWKTRDEGEVRIKDMADKHLVNCIRMAQRYGRVIAYRVGMSAGQYSEEHDSMGGEAAREVSDEAFDIMYDKEKLHEFCLSEFPKYRELIKEAERRDMSWE